jgi:glycosyltransferase involved in cell wall biosynthesis
MAGTGSAVTTHVGLNLLFLVPGETGGRETYARELLLALLAEASEMRFTAFVNRETAASQTGGPWIEAMPSVIVPVHARRRSEWVFGEQVLLPRLATQARLDLLHSLANTAPARGAFCRVATIHDMLYARLPDAVPALMRAGTSLLVRIAARRSQRIITGSVATASDLRHFLDVPGDRIDVVPCGVSQPATVATAPDELRLRYRLDGRRYVLAGALRLPHKNLERLIRALALIAAADRPLLVLTGNVTRDEDPLTPLARSLGIESDVRLTGWVPASDLEGLYRGAAAFVHPSLFEGFGLPVLEAMARGVPVACSNIPALREIADDDALMFDPRDPAGIAQAMQTILTDTARAAQLGDAGRIRAQRFTWEATAKGTLAAYERGLLERSSIR